MVSGANITVFNFSALKICKILKKDTVLFFQIPFNLPMKRQSKVGEKRDQQKKKYKQKRKKKGREKMINDKMEANGVRKQTKE